MKFKLKVLLFKAEGAASYGVDSTPLNTTNVILAQNVDINPMSQETDDYDPVSNTYGGAGKIVGAMWSTISFDVLLGGGGTPLATVPNHGPLYLASGFSQTVVAVTSVTFALVSAAEDSASMYFYNDGVLFKMLGIRGSLSWDWTAKKAPKLTFKGMGLVAAMTDTGMVVPTLPAPPRPVAVNKANTIVTIGGYAARIAKFSLDQGNDVQYRNLTGREEVVIVDRQPAGKVTLELPLVATKDFIGPAGICTLGSQVPASIVHGTVGGNIVTTTMAKIQLINPKLREEQGITMLDCDIALARTSGNDEFSHAYT